MLTRRLNALEQLEQRQMLTAVVASSSTEPGGVGSSADVNGDGEVDQRDVVQILKAGKFNTGQPASADQGDLNGDGVFDDADLAILEGQITYTEPVYGPGDANMDGKFNQTDLVELLQENKYETGEPTDWSGGDFNGDGLFDRADIILALQEGNYQSHGNDATAPVVGDTITQADIVRMLQCCKYNTGQPATTDEGDRNGDGKFDQLDLVQLQIEAAYLEPEYKPGDANMDGQFNQADILLMLQEAKYETGEPADWIQGDFNGDMVFNRYDVVAALQEGNYMA